MRCNSCNKFVSYDEPQVTTQDIEVATDTDTFTVSGSVEVRLICAECGTDLKTAELEFEHEVKVTLPEGKELSDNPTWSESSCEGTSRTEGKGRGMRTYYGFALTGTIEYHLKDKGAEDADDAEQSVEVAINDDIQASSMDEC